MYVPFEYVFSDWVTDRPAPIISDLCSVQAAGADPACPILAIYRRRRSAAAEWIAGAAKNKRFGAYMLQDGSYSMLYNDRGDPVYSSDSLLANQSGPSKPVVPVDRAAFLQEVRELTGDVGMSLIACREDHASASAADHSNFKVVCRRMIGEAGPEDLEHVVIVDSRRWPCPVTGVFANIAQLSPEMQNVFLDRAKWIENSLPMVWDEFREILADRLTSFRQVYVCDLLKDCGRVANMPEDRITTMVVQWLEASPGPKHRFALHIVETLRDGLIYERHTAEIFSPEIVESRGAAVVRDYWKHLTLSRN